MSHLVFHRANSHSSIEKAWQAGFQWIEFDIRRTKEKELVLFHDGEIQNGKRKEPTSFLSRVEMEDLAQEPVFTLESILQRWNSQLYMDLEIKEVGVEDEVVEMALHYLAPEQMVITSFWPESLMYIKKQYPQIRTGLLVAKNWPDKRFSKWIPTLFPTRKALASGADFLAPHYFFLSMGIVKRAQAKGLPLWFWTVNKIDILTKVIPLSGVEGIITDHLDWNPMVPPRSSPPCLEAG